MLPNSFNSAIFKTLHFVPQTFVWCYIKNGISKLINMKWQNLLSSDNLIKFYSSVDFSNGPTMVSQKPERNKTISWMDSIILSKTHFSNLSPHKSSKDFTGIRLFILDF